MENLDHKSNLFGKATPPMSEYQMENLERMASVSCKNEEAVELHGIVSKLREAIAKLIGDFMNSLQQGDKEGYKIFSSWCNSGLYDLVFGWGKLAWASIARIILNWKIWLIKPEFDEELLAFATMDISLVSMK
ncbi:hypothetical protein WN944_025571 [Citrus x changshan-huyou]|uniref:Uncharacterized protein n=1 Tax=Citrus x changshan-huyou TaxID=2935761 RepID=A0AAP0LQY0_9ROSI